MVKSRKERRKNSTDSRTYKMMARKYDMGTHCTLCPPNKGCNSYRWGINNNWKKHRKTQYRNEN